MLYFLFNRNRTRSNGGYFGYYSLVQWWNTEFTEAEKERFREVYESTHMLIPFDALFHGKEKPLMEFKYKKKSAVEFLTILLNNIVYINGCEDISQKFIRKCSQLIENKTENVDLDIYYLSQIKSYSRLRLQNAFYEVPFRKAFLSQIDTL
jgi:hypothetical protein